MEKRLLIAIVLSFVVLFAWQALFVKKPEPLPAQDLPVAAEQATGAESLPPIPSKSLPQEAESQTPDIKQPLETSQEAISEEREQKIIVDTPFYHAVWSNRGATLTSWRLKKHLDEEGNDLELISPNAEQGGYVAFALRTEDPQIDENINRALYKSSIRSLELLEGESQNLRFEYSDGSGTRVEKVFTFRGEGYDFDIEINLWKNGQRLDPYLVWGPQFGSLSSSSQSSRLAGSPGISIYSGAKVLRHDERKFDPQKSVYNFVSWAVYDDQFFMALFITDPQKSSAVFSRQGTELAPLHYLSVNHAFKAFVGPKQQDLLAELGYETKRAVRFGFFGFISEILYVAIKNIYKVFPNWGFSIIILTLLIKIVFFPLTYSSTKSMARMQELQPKIKALKSKYKKAKQDIEQRRKLNEETMRLYKEHGVNPAGGCLPMLIQLPIFWGFFRLLGVAIEFRHSPFILWIVDLSVKDPYYVIPILMGITQFISQKMTPTSGDATQQRMMLIMPVIMTFFFISFPAGLVLYWLTNNVLQIGQQYITNSITQKKKRESHAKRRTK